MARPHHAGRLVSGVVRHVGAAVEEPVDAVAAVGAHHRVPPLGGVLLDHVTDLAVLFTRSHCRQRGGGGFHRFGF